MFHKARKLTVKLGIHKDKNQASPYSSEDEYNERIQSFLTKVNSVNSVHEEEEDTSSNEDSNPQILINSRQPNSSDRKQSKPSYDRNSSNLELLLSLETRERLAAQQKAEEQKKRQSYPSPTTTSTCTSTPRQTKIKFELPAPPQRSRSPTAIAYPKARPVRSLTEEELTANQSRHSSKQVRPRRASWKLFGNAEETQKPVKYTSSSIFNGTRVRLKLRPLPTFGYVKYIGPVDFDEGEYIGVELDFGVGNCDGSVKGKRYFESEGKRGIFLRRNELEPVLPEEI